MRLNQVIALVTGKKAKATKLLTEVYRGWTRERLIGLERTYQPIHDDGVMLPSESKKVQLRVKDEMKKLRRSLQDFYGLVAAQEVANCGASADIKIADRVVIEKVPVGVLLFVEKQLVGLHTLAQNIPTLDVDKNWRHDPNAGLFITEPVQTLKTQRVEEPIVLYEATKEHPAQTKIMIKEVPIGTWTTTLLSGCMAVDEKEAMVERIEALQDAVKKAREEANCKAIDQSVGKGFASTFLQEIFGN